MLLTSGLRTVDSQLPHFIKGLDFPTRHARDDDHVGHLVPPGPFSRIVLIGEIFNSKKLVNVNKAQLLANRCGVSYGSVLSFLIPSFLEQRRLLVVSRHFGSSQIVHDRPRSGEGGRTTFEEAKRTRQA